MHDIALLNLFGWLLRSFFLLLCEPGSRSISCDEDTEEAYLSVENKSMQ